MFLGETLCGLENWVLNPGLFKLPAYRNYLKIIYCQPVVFYSFEGLDRDDQK